MVENPHYFAVSANSINNPALSWVHYGLGVYEPYLPVHLTRFSSNHETNIIHRSSTPLPQKSHNRTAGGPPNCPNGAALRILHSTATSLPPLSATVGSLSRIAHETLTAHPLGPFVSIPTGPAGQTGASRRKHTTPFSSMSRRTRYGGTSSIFGTTITTD